MRYLAMIYGDEKERDAMPPEEQEKGMKAWYKYSSDLHATGKMLGGEALQPTQTATTVRVQSEKTVISDGPFAETKEQLGGYFLIDAKDLDDAIALVATMPHLPYGGSVEVRPIWELSLPQS